jgi:hypothetical protein
MKDFMGEIVETLVANGIICKKIVLIDKKSLSTRKKIDCYVGVDTSSYYVSLWRRFSKTRLMSKEIQEFILLKERLENVSGHKIFKNYILVESDVCSKALHVLKRYGWKVLHV